ncbi:WecB/TagA/CpsF family glycosyltransferase [Nocardioides sp. GY 10113]|uniref:WecB/TagA/CpsF family glycosyltransferase n=1 Tax=Nocardioides sp. GY 10113 TaxID=2569761 RepID=UPI001458315A|nr:WecB/TagA/CpsF family glycosyltransferase [Nocardioides sp. GY 10113]
MTQPEVVHRIIARAHDLMAPPLAIASANLDHVHHFGASGRWRGTQEASQSAGLVEWLTLLDGEPLVRHVRRVTSQDWPKLAGSDLIAPLLDAAEGAGMSVGFLGGSPETHAELARRLADQRPALKVAGFWAPERAQLEDGGNSRRLAWEVRNAGADLLFVCLGKPRQEVWIAEYGHLTGARVMLAFGAAADFVAGKVVRAPSWVSERGLEWAWRLAQEPRRLARRYLLDAGPAYVAMRRDTRLLPGARGVQRGEARGPAGEAAALGEGTAEVPTGRTFVCGEGPADVTVVVVTYNSADTIGGLLADLRGQATDLRLRVVVVDNDSVDGTLAAVAGQTDVTGVRAGGNLGYAGGINVGLGVAGECRAVLVLNPDIRLSPDAVAQMWTRLWWPGVGAVVPKMLGEQGEVSKSLRFEPSLTRSLADALLGNRAPGRPAWATETDHDAESYCYPHAIDWATGAAMMLREEVSREVGRWDEQYFLYSEETDYCRRVREAGWSIWYEPSSVVEHVGGASGTSYELGALMAVNRLRYDSSHHGPAHTLGMRAILVGGAALRAPGRRQSRATLGYLVSRRQWDRLPAATPAAGGSKTSGAGRLHRVSEAGAASPGRRLQAVEPDSSSSAS